MAEVLGQLLLGWLLADFVSGLFHWLEDNFGMPTTPIIGRWIIAPNRLHHDRPTAFIDLGTFRSRNQAMIITALIVGSVLIALFGLHPWVISLMIGGGLINEVHAWSHRPSMAPRWARPLQEAGLLKSAKQHAGHHRPPFDRNYCILTSWLNPLLEAVGFWRRLGTLAGRAA